MAIAARILPPSPLIETPPQNVTRMPRVPLISRTNRNESSDICLPGGSPEKRQGTSQTASPVKHQIASPAASTSSLPSTDLQADLSASVPLYLEHEVTSNLNELSVAPESTPLKLHPVVSPTGLPNPIPREPRTMGTTTTGTQYQIEMDSYLPPVVTSPMQEVYTTPTTTPRRVDSNTDQQPEGLFSPTPEPREATTTLRAQEQGLPFHKGDFQSPFPNGDELVPEPLADSVKMEAGPLLSMIDLHQVECLYSKHWQLREKALQFLIDKLDAKKLVDEPLPSFRYTFYSYLLFLKTVCRSCIENFAVELTILAVVKLIKFLLIFFCRSLWFTLNLCHDRYTMEVMITCTVVVP